MGISSSSSPLLHFHFCIFIGLFESSLLKMYKVKLQELSQKKRWAMPKYSIAREGPDHIPCFKASVTVNGRSFHSAVDCKSSRDAHNNAAMVAYLNFTSQPSSESLVVTAEHVAKGVKMEKPYQCSHDSSDTSSGIRGLQFQHKNQLQNYAKRKKLGLPLYSSRSEGALDSLCFKATVTFDSRPFECADFFSTHEEAENAAARDALISLDFQEDASASHKNLLQELAQIEGFSMPIYNTVRCDAPQLPKYISTVEVEGERFSGKEGKSKKEAKQEAAKIAYTYLKRNGFIQGADFTSQNLVGDEVLQSDPISDSMIINAMHNLRHDNKPVSSPDTKHEKQAEGIKAQELNATCYIPVNAKLNTMASSTYLLTPEVDGMNASGYLTSCFQPGPLLEEGLPYAPVLTDPNLYAFSLSESSAGKTTGMKSYLLCNRVQVYTHFPEIAFPEGITVLPISDDKWVPVSLEFAKEKCN